MWSFGNNGRCQTASPTARLWMAVVGLVVIAVVVGCGGGGKPAAQTATKESPSPKAAPKSKEPNRAADDGAPAKQLVAAGGVRKSPRGIPIDAFFDNPLKVVEDGAAVAVAAPADKPAANVGEPAAKPTVDAPKPVAGGGGIVWSDYISIDILQEETKKLRNHLSSVMQKPGDFNKEPKKIGWEGAQLSALAGIVIEHGDPASWKANAHYIRDFGSDLSNTAVGPGKENYDKSKVAYEKLTSIFSGSVPADAGNVAAKRPFHETADRGGVMYRIQDARDWMRLNINNEAKLKSEKETILHEAAVMAALGKVISTDGYGGTDEEEYQKYANDLINGAKEATAAASDQSFSKFTDAINKIAKSCSDCHPKYAQ